MCLGVDLRKGTRRHVLNEIGLRAQNLLIVIGSIVNIIGGDLYDHLRKKDNLHFNNA